MAEWNAFIKSIKTQSAYYRAVASDPRTPRLSKWLIVIAMAFLVSPIDIIPDFIPVIGQVDDLIIVPGLIWIALRMVPEDVKYVARTKS